MAEITDPLAPSKELPSIYQMGGVVKLFKHRLPHPYASEPVFIELPGILT